MLMRVRRVGSFSVVGCAQSGDVRVRNRHGRPAPRARRSRAARAPARLAAARVLRPRRDLFEIAAVLETIHGGHRRFLEFAVDGDGEQCRRDRADGRTPPAESVRARAWRAIDASRCESDASSSRDSARRATGSRCELFAICASVRASESASTAATLWPSSTPSKESSAMSRSMVSAPSRTLASPSSRAMPARAEGSSSLATAARRTRTSSSSRAAAAMQIALGERELGDVGKPDRRIRVLLPRLRAEPIEQRHEMPSPVRRAATSWPCVAVWTCLSMSRMRPSRPM